MVFERKILRDIFGAVEVDQVWRCRTNQELNDLLRNHVSVSILPIFNISNPLKRPKQAN